MYTQIKKFKLPTFALCMVLLMFSCSKDEVIEKPELIEESPALNAVNELSAKASSLKNPVSIMYVEVNDNQMSNVGAYTLPNGNPLIDIAMIFAANINYDKPKKKAVLSLNSQVRSTLNNKATTIKPLQNKGIKVLLSILGNHQGVGIANFTTKAKAKDFALQVARVVKNNGLDGVDLDDEFAKYGTNGQPMPHPNSFIWLLQELRAAMPGKLITYYKIGPSANQLTSQGKNAGQFLNYAYNPYYGTYNNNIGVPGLGKRKLGAAAVNVQQTSLSLATNMAMRTKTDGYGAFIMYNLDGTNRTNYLNSISQKLYGKRTKLTGTLKN